MSRFAPAAARGFTLVELLVALTLLGLLMVALFGGLRLGARAWEVSGERLEDTSRLQVIHEFLHTRLSQTYPLEVTGRAGQPRLAFRGGPDALSFVTLLPEHMGAGVHRLTLRLVERDDRLHLALSWRPFAATPDAEANEDEASSSEERLLLRDIAGLELGYFGALAPREPPVWSESWHDALLRLPQLIRVRVIFPAGDRRSWPVLIVRPMIDPGFAQRF